MNLIVIILSLIMMSTACEVSDVANKARYDHYRLYRLFLETEEHVKLMQDLEEKSDSYTFIGHARHTNQNLSIFVSAHKIAEINDIMERYRIQGTLLMNNLQELIDAEEATIKPKDVSASDFGWENYYHLETINKWMTELVKNYSFVSKVSLGKSFEGNEVSGVKLSKKEGNKAVFIEGGIHAREWISPATCTFILNQLLTSNDPEVLNIANNFDWYFFPVVNPDGYKYTFEADRLWRKNKKPYGRCRGVDLNRNFDSNWNGTGSSPDPCRYDFAGGAAASEPEVANIQNYLKAHAAEDRIKTYISVHSFSQLLMFPYGYTEEKAKNYEDLKLIGEKAVKAIKETHGKVYESGSLIETIYPSSGDSMDWAFTNANIPISYTIELRGPPDSTDMFILPAEQIIPTGEETLAAFVAILKEARELGYYD